MKRKRINVALIEDSKDEREELVALLEESSGFNCVRAYENAESALAELPEIAPDVILVDINLPGMSGTACVRQLRARMSAAVTRIMMLTVFEDHDRIFQALRAG